jgi:predicted ABC-type ATPase
VKSGVLDIPKDAVTVNPDIVKTMLPEYDPLKGVDAQTAAGRVHEESSDVSKTLAGVAYGRKHHVLFDAVGDSEKGKYLKKIRAAQEHGHNVRIAYAAQDEEKAWEFAKKRAEKSGRHVNEDFFRSAHKGVRDRLRDDILPAKDIPLDVYDTTKFGKPRLIATRKAGGELDVKDKAAFDKWLKTGRIG